MDYKNINRNVSKKSSRNFSKSADKKFDRDFSKSADKNTDQNSNKFKLLVVSANLSDCVFTC